MSKEEIDALWAQSSQGLRPTIAPLSAFDFALEAGGQLLDEADLSSLPLIGGVAAAAVTKGKAKPKGGLKPKLTADAVLEEAARPGKKLTFSDFTRDNPMAGENLFDLSNAQPAMPDRPMLPRYDPPRGTSPRVAEALKKASVRKKLEAMVQQGKEMMPDSWYRTGPLFDVFKRELEDGAEAKFQRFMELVAATSPRSRVPDNIRTASYYNHLDAKGLPIPEAPAKGYGSVAQKLHKQNVENINAGGLNPLQNPKPASFVENLLGNENPVTIDTHNFRALGMASKDPRFLASSIQRPRMLPDGTEIFETYSPAKAYANGELTMAEALKQPTYWASAPNANEYKAYEEAQQAMAQKLGMTPAEWQEKMWVGGGATTGLDSPPEPFLRTLASRIAYTAERMKATPEEVLSKFVRGEIPLLQFGGAAALGAGSMLELTQPDSEPARR